MLVETCCVYTVDEKNPIAKNVVNFCQGTTIRSKCTKHAISSEKFIFFWGGA